MFGVGAGIACLAVEGLYGLVILKLLIKHLPDQIAGFWTVVMTVGSFLMLLQVGMGPTISREIAGIPLQNLNTAGPQLLLALSKVRKARRYIGILIMIVAGLVFAAYLLPLAVRCSIVPAAATACLSYAIGVVLYVVGLFDLFVINGLGEVGWDKVLRTVSVSVGLVGAWLNLTLGGGIVGLGLVFLAQNMIFRSACGILAQRYIPYSNVSLENQEAEVGALFAQGGKLLYLNVLTYIVSNAGILVFEREFGLEKLPGYTAITRIALLLGTIGNLVPQMAYPRIASAWARKDITAARRYYLSSVASAVILFVISSIPIIILRQWLFANWIGAARYLGDGLLFLFIGHQLIAVHHAAHASASLATQGNAFAVASTVNVFLVVIATVILPRQFGPIGFPIAMILGTIPSSLWIVHCAWRKFYPVASE